MKKIVTLISAIALLLCSLSACGREAVDISGAKSLADINGTGAIIAAQKDTFHADAMEEQLTGVTKQILPDFDTLLTALNSGAIDGYVAEKPTALDVCGRDESFGYVALVNNDTGFVATPGDTGIAVAFKTGSSRVAEVNTILSTITPAQREALMANVVQVAADPDTAVADFSLPTSGVAQTGGVLKVAMECAYHPFNWTQTKDVNGAVPMYDMNGTKLSTYANGYDVQIAKYIAAELGLTLEVYQCGWDSLISSLDAGTVDAIIAGMSPTAEREEQVDFTDCYYNSDLVIIYKKKA